MPLLGPAITIKEKSCAESKQFFNDCSTPVHARSVNRVYRKPHILSMFEMAEVLYCQTSYKLKCSTRQRRGKENVFRASG